MPERTVFLFSLITPSTCPPPLPGHNNSPLPGGGSLILGTGLGGGTAAGADGNCFEACLNVQIFSFPLLHLLLAPSPSHNNSPLPGGGSLILGTGLGSGTAAGADGDRFEA